MTEDRLKRKYRVFEALLDKKKKRFDQLSEFQDDQLESINDADMDQNSIVENQTEEMLREVRTENETLDHLKEEINKLEDYKSFREKEIVGPGTVVITDKFNLVVSVPQRTFEVDGKKYNGISTESPIYQVLVGKTSGEKVDFNGQSIEINEVI